MTVPVGAKLANNPSLDIISDLGILTGLQRTGPYLGPLHLTASAAIRIARTTFGRPSHVLNLGAKATASIFEGRLVAEYPMLAVYHQVAVRT